MPLRPPRPGESQSTYMRYCVPFEIDAGRPQRQAVAICLSVYRRKKDLPNISQEGKDMTEITVLLEDEGIDPSWEQTLVTDGKDLEEWEIDFIADIVLASDEKAIEQEMQEWAEEWKEWAVDV